VVSSSFESRLGLEGGENGGRKIEGGEFGHLVRV
jgi:hypothetical protein